VEDEVMKKEWYATKEELEGRRKTLPPLWRLLGLLAGDVRLVDPLVLTRNARKKVTPTCFLSGASFLGGLILAGLVGSAGIAPSSFGFYVALVTGGGLMLFGFVLLLRGIEKAIEAGWFEWGIYVPS
jgi:hypothetical protein